MLGSPESRGAALLLSTSHRVKCERRLARACRPVDLDDAAARETADAQGDIEPKRAGRNGLDLDRLARAEAHGRALAEGAVDLRQRGIEGFLLVHIFGIPVGYDFQGCHHGLVSPRMSAPPVQRLPVCVYALFREKDRKSTRLNSSH